MKSDGSSSVPPRETLIEIADLIAFGELVMPITAVYPFAKLHDAYRELERRKARGKIVLAMDPTIEAVVRASDARG